MSEPKPDAVVSYTTLQNYLDVDRPERGTRYVDGHLLDGLQPRLAWAQTWRNSGDWLSFFDSMEVLECSVGGSHCNKN